jgi:hypothetical protein
MLPIYPLWIALVKWVMRRPSTAPSNRVPGRHELPNRTRSLATREPTGAHEQNSPLNAGRCTSDPVACQPNAVSAALSVALGRIAVSQACGEGW